MCFPVQWRILRIINVRLMFKGRIRSDFVMNPNLFPRILLEKHKNSLIFGGFVVIHWILDYNIVNEN